MSWPLRRRQLLLWEPLHSCRDPGSSTRAVRGKEPAGPVPRSGRPFPPVSHGCLQRPARSGGRGATHQPQWQGGHTAWTPNFAPGKTEPLALATRGNKTEDSSAGLLPHETGVWLLSGENQEPREQSTWPSSPHRPERTGPRCTPRRTCTPLPGSSPRFPPRGVSRVAGSGVCPCPGMPPPSHLSPAGMHCDLSTGGQSFRGWGRTGVSPALWTEPPHSGGSVQGKLGAGLEAPVSVDARAPAPVSEHTDHSAVASRAVTLPAAHTHSTLRPGRGGQLPRPPPPPPPCFLWLSSVTLKLGMEGQGKRSKGRLRPFTANYKKTEQAYIT